MFKFIILIILFILSQIYGRNFNEEFILGFFILYIYSALMVNDIKEEESRQEKRKKYMYNFYKKYFNKNFYKCKRNFYFFKKL